MSGFADQTDQSKTWMLFESGNGVSVDLSLYSPSKDKARLIDAYVVTECEGDFTGSARRAAEAVYNVVRQHGSMLDPVVVGYDLQGLPGGRPVTGESGGLAFAIALAKQVLEQDPGPVAATGEVKSGHGGGPVGAVKGIVAKLEAAGRLMPENGFVFYPKENDSDIQEGLRRSLTDKGLRLQPVSSVAEALGLLFELPEPQIKTGPPPPKGRRTLLATGIILTLMCMSVLAVLRIHGWPPFGRDTSQVSGDQVKDQISDAVTGEKDTGIGDVPAPHPLVEIELTGKTDMSSELAELTTEKIRNIFKGDKRPVPGAIRISGHVVILKITEEAVDNKGALSTTMTVAVKGFNYENGKESGSFPVLSVSVGSSGKAKTLLPKAALALAQEIVKAMTREDHKRSEPAPPSKIPGLIKDMKDTKTDHGFE